MSFKFMGEQHIKYRIPKLLLLATASHESPAWHGLFQTAQISTLKTWTQPQFESTLTTLGPDRLNAVKKTVTRAEPSDE